MLQYSTILVPSMNEQALPGSSDKCHASKFTRFLPQSPTVVNMSRSLCMYLPICVCLVSPQFSLWLQSGTFLQGPYLKTFDPTNLSKVVILDLDLIEIVLVAPLSLAKNWQIYRVNVFIHLTQQVFPDDWFRYISVHDSIFWSKIGRAETTQIVGRS